MKNDISRNTFDPTKHFSRVLMQQGRVQLDADWNEQASIFMHYLRTLATDLIGPYGGPAEQCGFEIIDAVIAKNKKLKLAKDASFTTAGFFIGPGRYYVDGLLCENEDYVPFFGQGDSPFPGDPKTLKDQGYLAYLDVWERLITGAEDEGIREVALGGADTTTRSKVVWQVKFLDKAPANREEAEKVLREATRRELPLLRAQLKQEAIETDPCILSPDSRYRGAENQLYRVEIHQGTEKGRTPTFKWSRENGSVVFPVTEAPIPAGDQTVVSLAHFGRDAHLGLTEGDWVELVDDDYVVSGQHEPLRQVHSIQREDGTVTLRGVVKAQIHPEKHPLLRRWDQRAGDKEHGGLELLDDGAAAVVPSDDKNPHWLNLEDGVQILFTNVGEFRTGDYWIIPARTENGIDWPQGLAKPPRGIVHHYAPLAVVNLAAGAFTSVTECRHGFAPLDAIKTSISSPDPGTAPTRLE